MTPEHVFADVAAWHEWLTAEHETSDGVWLVLAKKGTTDPTSLTYDEALEEALCHGWIDGQRVSRDAHTFKQRYTPRRPRSNWSQRNVGIIQRLETEGRMRPAGRAEVERAKTDGRWEAAYGLSTGRDVPADLAEALAASPRAEAMFAILTQQNRFAILYRLTNAKRAETRTKWITRYVDELGRGETPYPQKRTLD
ncbi:YdeI/OmpD-associated family protein [Kribbella sp. NPDC051770]|uniref:YdeI/OmpD-associated family protein n=1 Tax=Kribbella sp. NPDC051770 TaxID=3155413 RepID=UPI0034335356